MNTPRWAPCFLAVGCASWGAETSPKDVVIAASQSGKIKTTLQGVALAVLLMPLPHGDAHGGAFDAWGGFGEVLFYLSQVFLAGAVIMTMWSGYEFFRAVWQQRPAPTA